MPKQPLVRITYDPPRLVLARGIVNGKPGTARKVAIGEQGDRIIVCSVAEWNRSRESKNDPFVLGWPRSDVEWIGVVLNGPIVERIGEPLACLTRNLAVAIALAAAGQAEREKVADWLNRCQDQRWTSQDFAAELLRGPHP